ncbi:MULTISPECIES: hypothetical protein [unclassified Bradyrhizobium]|uniref:hypothetical protein n=1 Tax=unclassified Bradyrhizobium TaxID=2631580 RepID=UPI0007101436|nr:MULTISPECIES: hypothetical protein [unclassified Bradyrhizobium]
MATSVPSVPSVPPPGQAKAVVTKAAEGQYRPGPYLLSEGWLSATAGKFMNWWQMGYSIQPYGPAGAMVEACVSAYSQTVAMCPGGHWRSLPEGGREAVTTSDLGPDPAQAQRLPVDLRSAVEHHPSSL